MRYFNSSKLFVTYFDFFIDLTTNHSSWKFCAMSSEMLWLENWSLINHFLQQNKVNEHVWCSNKNWLHKNYNLEIDVTIVIWNKKKEQVITHIHLTCCCDFLLMRKSWCSIFHIQNKKKTQKTSTYEMTSEFSKNLNDDIESMKKK